MGSESNCGFEMSFMLPLVPLLIALIRARLSSEASTVADEDVAAGIDAALGVRGQHAGRPTSPEAGGGGKGEEKEVCHESAPRGETGMLTLRPTKMLARRLKIEVPAVPPPVANRVADWCVHEFRDGRVRYLIFCNTASLYPVVTYGRGVTDDGALLRRYLNAMKSCLGGTELEFQFQRWIVPEWGEVQWAPIPDKAVLSSVNETIMRARSGMDKSPVELSQWLGRCPMSVLGGKFPDRVFAGLSGDG